MAKKVCKICNSEDESALFNVPKDKAKRATWIEACKTPLLSCSFICKKHFKPQDIIRKRLKRNALPLPDGVSKQYQVKEEHLSEEDDDELRVERIRDPLVVVKVENAEPSHLIHEETFDELNRNFTESGPLSPVVSGSAELICGQVVLLENENFKLRCKYCNEAFEITNGQSFVKHLKALHAAVLCNKNSCGNAHVEASALNEPDKIPNAADVKPEFDDLQMDIDFEHSEISTDNEDAFEIKPKKSTQTNKTEKRKTAAKNCKENLLTFDTVPQTYVVHFLELISTNAILWHRRQSILKRFDEALKSILTTFNEANPEYQLTEESARISINRIKELYLRVTDVKHKRYIKNSAAHKKKFPTFFEHCKTIVENSKKIIFPCNKCRAFFFIETELQVHQVKRHRIGEMPFKCSRCNYGFKNAEKRDEHEAKHDRARDFICEVCNRGFNSEDKLRTHAKNHSDDVNPVCEKCGQMFDTYNKYRRHKLRHEAPKQKCHLCDKVFYEKYNLSEHVKSHLNERSYNCDICQKSFNHQNDVKIHQRGVHGIQSVKKRARWVNKSELSTTEDKESQADSSSNESQNAYSDNYHHFRPQFYLKDLETE